MKSEWIMCPICGNKTRDKIREDTELKNFPLYCPKCKQESLIDAKNLQITVIKEPDAKTQSRWSWEMFHSSSALLLLYAWFYCLSQGIEVVFIFCSAIVKLLCKGIAINTVISAERTSAIGCAYKIPFNPHINGKLR